MFTQCPHCLTLFRITPEHLKAAEGQVRCCQCNKVFNALQTLQETPAPFSNEDVSSAATDNGTPAQDGLFYYAIHSDDHDSALINDSEVERSLDDLADDSTPIPAYSDDSNLESDDQALLGDSQSQFVFEQDDGLATEPDYFALGTESHMSELLDQDSASLLLENEPNQANLAEIIELDIPEPDSEIDEQPEDLNNLIDELEHELDSSSEKVESSSSTSLTAPATDPAQDNDQPEKDLPFTFEAQDTDKTPSQATILWTIGSLLLLIPLCGQLAWQFRDNLIHHEMGRQLLDTVCSVAGCSTPLRIDRDKIMITERSLTAHPDIENTLSMQLEMVNTAPFEQPFPNLQLSLYNDIGTLIARRTFSESEYRLSTPRSDNLMPKLKPIHIELLLIDPGKEVTGFKFEFL
jgi:predicted Zn finger-like uncharacterized protein